MRDDGRKTSPSRSLSSGSPAVSHLSKAMNVVPLMLQPAIRLMRVPGQVPSSAAADAMKLMLTEPPPFRAETLLRQDGAYLTAKSVVANLGFDRVRETSWAKFLSQALREPNELVLRKTLFQKMREERLQPELRQALFQRAMLYRRDLKKAMVGDQVMEIVTADELAKAEPRGGKYHRRVPAGDGYRYFYDPDAYHRREDAHVSGMEATKAQVYKGVCKAVDDAGDGGCPVDGLKGLVERYGAKAVGEVLEEVRNSGKVVYRGGKLYAARQPEEST